MMNLGTQLDFSQIPQGRPFTVRLLVTLEAPAQEGASKRPLNLAVVLDRSGSMSGRKLACVREATRALFERLSADDRFALVAYDDQVDDVVLPTRVGSACGVLERIGGIHSGGTTFLSGGYRRGCELAEEGLASDRVTRVLLLSDGLANVGETAPRALATLAAQMQERGITTTTLGVGDGYHEELMGQMAEQGGGGAYFIERPEDALSVFQEELGYLQSLAATDVWVAFVPALDGVRHEQLNTYRVAEQGYYVSEVYGGQRRSLVLECQIPALAGTQEVDLGEIRVSWRPAGSDSDALQHLVLPVTVRPVDAETFAGLAPQAAVVLDAAFLTVARAKGEAIRLADHGDFQGAAAMLRHCAELIASLHLEDATLATEVEILRQRAERFQHDGAGYFQVRERKTLFHESDNMAKAQMAKYHAMAGRRQGRPAEEGQPGALCGVYPCYLANGHPVIETQEGRLLLDTGAMRSFGEMPSVRLGDKTFDLERSCFGLTLQDISALIGVRLSALLGSDVLGSFDWRLDLKAGEWAVDPAPLGRRATLVNFDTDRGVPVVEVQVADRPVRLFLDTGAKLSYLAADYLTSAEPQGRGRDFFPRFGTFETDLYRLPLRLGPKPIPMPFGVLPRRLQSPLSMTGARGILGASVLERFRLHFFSSRRAVAFEPI